MTTTKDVDVAVIGLGALGSAACYWLSRYSSESGRSVVGLEQFPIGHLRGESEDHSRIIRLSYHTPRYVRFAQAAYDAWHAVEDDIGHAILTLCGGIDLWPTPSALRLDDYTRSMDECGVGYESMTAGEVMAAWPQFRLTDDVTGVYQHAGGIAPPFIGNAAHRDLARQRGVELRDNTPVTGIHVGDGEVVVQTPDTRYRCARLVIASGPWTNTVLGQLGHQLPLTVTQEQVTYFATPHLDEFTPDRFPVWIWMDEPSFYGFPVFGEPATKAAWDAGGKVVTADTRSFDPDPANAASVREFVERVIPRSTGPELYTKTCLYTMPPDRDFVLDHLPGHPEILLAIGAGHAYKFCSVIGQTIAHLALHGTTDRDISDFSFDRPVLHLANPPTRFSI
jgi:sarcosine oxidase